MSGRQNNMEPAPPQESVKSDRYEQPARKLNVSQRERQMKRDNTARLANETLPMLKQSIERAHDHFKEVRQTLRAAKDLPDHPFSRAAEDCARMDVHFASWLLRMVQERSSCMKGNLNFERRRTKNFINEVNRLKKGARQHRPVSSFPSTFGSLRASDEIEDDRRQQVNHLRELEIALQKLRTSVRITEAIDRDILHWQKMSQEGLNRTFELFAKLSQRTRIIVKTIKATKADNATEDDLKNLKWHSPNDFEAFNRAYWKFEAASNAELDSWYEWNAASKHFWICHFDRLGITRDIRQSRYRLEELDGELTEAMETERRIQQKYRRRQERKRQQRRQKQHELSGSPNPRIAATKLSTGASKRKRRNVSFDARTPSAGI